MNEANVTIVIRTKNSEETIAQVLAALFSQDFSSFEVLVIDSGSTDKTLEIVNLFNCKVKIIDPIEYFPGKVLNEAIETLNSEIIVFLNSDTVMLSPRTLSSLLAALNSSNVAGVFARQLPRPDAEGWVRRDYGVSFPESRQVPNWMHLSLPLAAIKRSVWEKHPFYTLAWGSEDTEWGYWAKQNGYIVQYVSDAIVMHSHNYNLKQLYGRRFIEGEADAFIFQRSLRLRNMILNWIKSCFHDVSFYIKQKKIKGFFFIPILRFVYHWAYYKGNLLGNDRIRKNCSDASIGQSNILKRY